MLLAVAKLGESFPVDRFLGQPCRVTESTEHEALWDAARARLGRVDIWINNAGIGHPMRMVWELEPELIGSVVSTNVTGATSASGVSRHAVRW